MKTAKLETVAEAVDSGSGDIRAQKRYPYKDWHQKDWFAKWYSSWNTEEASFIQTSSS